VRSEVRGDNGRDVEWELGKDTNFDGGPDKEKSTFEQLLFHVSLPARDKDGKAEKVVKKLDVTFKNEWRRGASRACRRCLTRSHRRRRLGANGDNAARCAPPSPMARG
jgi:hypothetical protein